MRPSNRRTALSRIFADSPSTFTLALILIFVSLVLGNSLFFPLCAPHSEVGERLPAFVSLTAEFLKELGFALVIGVMIVEGIERLSRSEQIEQVDSLIGRVKENVIEAVYGTEAANIFFKPFKDRVINKPLLRKRCIMEVNITCGSANLDSNSVILMDVALTFSVLNCSDQDLRQSIPAHLERPWPEIEKMAIPGLGVKGVKVRIADETDFRELAVTPVRKDTNAQNDLDAVAYEFEVPAKRDAAVIFSYKLAKFARDASSFFSVIATEEMVFDFTFDPRLDLSYTNVHALDFIDETPPKSPNRLKLRTREPLFPDNGIQFWWSPKR